ncbi:MAG: hypothetical protein H0T84_00260 [Tatlockia sp.]|nr:hypothetical protein [Tatlockia sp.]
MFTNYESDVNGKKSYYRFGTHPVTEKYEFFLSLDNQTWKPINITGRKCNHRGFVFEFASDFELTILYNSSSSSSLVLTKNAKTSPQDFNLREITFEALPPGLKETELEELDRQIEALEKSILKPDLPKEQPVYTVRKQDSQQLKLIEQQYNLLRVMPEEETSCYSENCLNISMQVLGLFIGVVGIAAVAVAFIALNALSGGTLGLVVAAVGVTAMLGGFGLFGGGLYRSCNPETPEPDNYIF